ncbi:phosphoglycerate mutase-like protein [Lentithecium fluviatile CBS 122367]|uniref:Phosphoglycerate mutase-like protein n=1 Tax=Lentithecium fluviatile CBS 122367 TaxID=1168545 RepID=A0A6G1IZA0_9PLEO|nr:phosphoglycerate mutase-like protein [Lentithecium fluviatile CBS 122367]
MPPTLLLIRHAQALHNVADDWSLHDPALSELGEQQCKELQESLKNSKIGHEVELIVVSAMRRTLQTASIGLEWLIKEKGIKVLPDAGWQENADKPCDTGSPIATMAQEFPDFDFSVVDPLYPDKTTNLASNPYAFTGKAILARGQTCLKALYSRPEKVIAVVSHSGFLRVAVANRRFFNADWRVFDYDGEKMRESKANGEGIDGQGMFALKEWKETEENGGAMGRSEKGFFTMVQGDYPEIDDEETKEMPK